jgi:hypothetical protein
LHDEVDVVVVDNNAAFVLALVDAADDDVDVVDAFLCAVDADAVDQVV